MELIKPLLTAGLVLSMTVSPVMALETQPSQTVSVSTTSSIKDTYEVTGYDAPSQVLLTLTYASDDRPSLSEVLDDMPDTIGLCLDGSLKATDVPVTWTSFGGDYEAADEDYYMFVPSFDESVYKCDDAPEDRPYVAVMMEESETNYVAAAHAASATTASTNQKAVYNYLRSTMGLNAAAACGVMANIQCESGFVTTVNGDNGKSYGLCQWYSSRKTAMINWCTANGYSKDSVAGQMGYLYYELTTGYKTTWKKLQSVANTATGAYNAAYYFCKWFEKPSNLTAQCKKRGNLASNTFFPTYSGSSVTVAPTISVTILDEDGDEATYLYKNQSYTLTWKLLNSSTGKALSTSSGSYTVKTTIGFDSKSASGVSGSMAFTPTASGSLKYSVSVSGSGTASTSKTLTVYTPEAELHVWTSKSKYGTETTNLTTSSGGYLNYTLTDANTGEAWNDVEENAEYLSTSKLSTSDGASVTSVKSESADKVSVPVNLDKEETCTASVDVSGELDASASVKVSFSSASSVLKVTATTSSYTYTGKNITPKIKVTLDGKKLASSQYKVTYTDSRKTIGVHCVKVTLKSDTDLTATTTYKIIPKATKIKSLKKLSKGFKVTCVKKNGGARYNVRYSTKKNMSVAKYVYKTKNTITVKGLKKKKVYYVQVRTYKKVNGKFVASAWSSVKKVNTK